MEDWGKKDHIFYLSYTDDIVMNQSWLLCLDIIGCNSVDQEDVGTCDIAVIKRKRDRTLLSRVFLARFYVGASHE